MGRVRSRPAGADDRQRDEPRLAPLRTGRPAAAGERLRARPAPGGPDRGGPTLSLAAPRAAALARAGRLGLPRARRGPPPCPAPRAAAAHAGERPAAPLPVAVTGGVRS